MNFSVSRLSIQALSQSPRISLPYSCVTIERSAFSRQFSPAFLSCANNFAINVYNSQFSMYLSAAISASSLFPARIYSRVTSSAQISCSLFNGFSSTSNGGAISIVNESCNVSMAYCYFYNCYTSVLGGAIYLDVCYYSVKTCYFQCCCATTGQSIYVIATANGTFSLNSVILCGNSTSIGYSYSIALYPANSFFYNVNSTLNRCTTQSAAVTFWPTTSSVAHFCQISSDISGPYMINCQTNCNPYIIDQFNIVNNTVTSLGLFIVDRGASKLNITNCIFFKNTMASVVTVGSAGAGGVAPSFISCVFDFGMSSLAGCTTSNCITSASPITNSISLFSGNECGNTNYFSQPPFDDSTFVAFNALFLFAIEILS